MGARQRKEILELLDKLRAQGWKVFRTASMHYQCIPPGSGRIYVCSSSGDFWALRNAKRDFIRAGAKL